MSCPQANRPRALGDGPLQNYPKGCQLLDVEHVARQSNGADVRRIVPSDNALKFHPFPVVLGDRPEGRSDTFGLFVNDLILDDNDAPFGQMLVGETKRS